MDFDDYEKLPTSNVTTYMTAGAVAGVMEHCVMYPLDSVKTQMQNLSPSSNAAYRGIGETLVRMVKQEGVFRPVRGMSAVVVGAAPAHALYFACYEQIKDFITQTTKFTNVAYGVAGCASTVLHDLVMNPAEVVKQRMQMYNSPYKAVLECMVKIYRTEGVRAFYRSYTTQLTMNVPFQSIHFMMYESMQNLTNPDNQYNPAAHMVSGACAGAVAAAVTTPLDVCKTFLNTQPLLVGQTGLVHAVRTVYKLGGARGYFRGVQARVLFQMPATAICWSVYELFKYLLLAKPADIDLDLRLEDSAELKLFPEIKSVAPMPSAAPIKTIEMPSVSGASIYGALSLNTMHNSDNGVSQTGLLRDMRHS